jgi:hypothetical protein
LKILNLDSLIKPRIQLKSNLDYESALNFLSTTLNIPHEKFNRPLIFPKKPRKASKSRISPFGSLVIQVNSALALRLMKYWIQTFLIQRMVGPEGISAADHI